MSSVNSTTTVASNWISNTSNSTWPPSSGCTATVPDSYSTKVIKAITLSAILLCAIIANSFVIVVFVKIRSLQRGINFFLVNMAVADLIIPMLFVPKELVDIITGSSIWRVDGDFGLALCKLHPFLLDACLLVSVLSLIWITVDRFRAVIMPFKLHGLDEKRSFAIASTWIIGLIVYTPYFYANKLYHSPQGYTLCFADWSPLDHIDTTVTFVIIIIVSFGIIPWMLFAVLYFLIIQELKSSRSRVSNYSDTGPLPRSQDRTLSVLKQALAVAGAFALCQFPMVTFYIIVAFVNKFMCPVLPYWSEFFFTAKTLLLSNTFINPCICLFLNENYRNGLRAAVRGIAPGRVGTTSVEMGRTNRARASTIESLS